MLAALTVRDIVLIESAALEFAPGLNVLTGETGAGKSILLDALGLAAGNRGRAGVRPGAQQGSASAVFAPPAQHPARALLDAQSLPQSLSQSEDLVLRRTVSADGRTRAFVNDEPVGVAFLKDLGGLLLEVHGQADDRGLFDAGTHRALLDAFGGHDALLSRVAAAHAALSAARAERDRLAAAAHAAAQDADFIRHAARELADLAPEEDEETRLVADRALMSGAARTAEDVEALRALVSDDKGAEMQLAGALKRLARLKPEARAAAAALETALESASNAASDASRELDALAAKLHFSPAQLERLDDRLHALRAAARKYGVAPAALPALAADYAARLDGLDGGGGQLKKAGAVLKAARAAWADAGALLSDARRDAAKRLEKAVAAELAPLKLGHARFRVTLTPLDDGEDSATGAERIAFEVATVEGAAFGSLARIASGGELARFSLALKVALAATGAPAVMVFDEVDRGVGGAVADAVGLRLQRLSRATQVLLVTHAPQVAARADRHFRISRKGDRTRIDVLSDDERLEEIARMLSGAAVTAEARAAARRLMDEARLPVPSAPAAPKTPRKRA